jgi:hypothetical protein
MKYKKLYLDDIRTPKSDGWEIVRSYEGFVEWITNNGVPDEISFDHDLSREHINFYFENGGHENPPNPQETVFNEKTGYDAAKWLCQYCLLNSIPLPLWNVHSANPVGRDNIEGLLKNFEKVNI